MKNNTLYLTKCNSSSNKAKNGFLIYNLLLYYPGFFSVLMPPHPLKVGTNSVNLYVFNVLIKRGQARGHHWKLDIKLSWRCKGILIPCALHVVCTEGRGWYPIPSTTFKTKNMMKMVMLRKVISASCINS